MNKNLEHQPACQYCDKFLRPGTELNRAKWDVPVLETDHFVVVPTVGMLVPGWLLIISKKHHANLASLSKVEVQDFLHARDITKDLLQRTFGMPLFFEHGPCLKQQNAGSCIDHAHYHAVPWPKDLMPLVSRDFKWNLVGNFNAVQKSYTAEGAYLLYENHDGEMFCSHPKKVPSQYFRQVIAREIGRPNDWDWAVFPEYETIEITQSKFLAAGKRFCPAK